jgi:uncharacterized protein DUF5655
MRQLPKRPNLDQLRRQARELQRRSRLQKLSTAQLVLARAYGFRSWARLKAEVDARSSSPALASVRGWEAMRDRSARLLEKRTGADVEAWKRRMAREPFDSEAALRRWLTQHSVTGYAQTLLVWERFGYPSFIVAGAGELIDGQYADRPNLRPIFDAVVDALPGIGDVAVQARKGYVSLVSKRRTFAIIKATTKHRVDLGFRLENAKPAGRLLPASGLGNGSFSVRLGLASHADLDRDALAWLKRAYDENA